MKEIIFIYVPCNKTFSINIYDGSGRRVRADRIQVVKGYNLLTISGLSKMASGIYYIEIKDGLAEGDEVVTGPFNAISKTLKDGTVVKVVPKDKLFEN